MQQDDLWCRYHIHEAINSILSWYDTHQYGTTASQKRADCCTTAVVCSKQCTYMILSVSVAHWRTTPAVRAKPPEGHARSVLQKKSNGYLRGQPAKSIRTRKAKNCVFRCPPLVRWGWPDSVSIYQVPDACHLPGTAVLVVLQYFESHMMIIVRRS